uniref:Uncharacterized protein n=1 Tax=Arundo donax TaxID=35708 RepID=A0A0A8Z8U1_ARUDO
MPDVSYAITHYRLVQKKIVLQIMPSSNASF